MITGGRRVYGLGAVVLGVPALAIGKFEAMGLPVPTHGPAAHVAACACAVLLIVAGVAANLPRVAPAGCLAIAAFFTLWMLGLHLPDAFVHPTTWVSWEVVAEKAAMALGGLLTYALLTGVSDARAAAIARIARPAFGVCLVVFGVSEFVYVKFTASLVPAWLPPSQVAWAYATGVAHIAAGLAILSGVRALLAAILLTAMYLGFQALVHLPRVIADPANVGAWSENGVNLLLTGAAWALADALVARRVLADAHRAMD